MSASILQWKGTVEDETGLQFLQCSINGGQAGLGKSERTRYVIVQSVAAEEVAILANWRQHARPHHGMT